jgi:hypothetical protein
MASHPDVNHLPRLQLNDEEGKQRSEQEISDRQAITGPDLVCMVAQEGGPRLRRRPHTFRAHILLDGPLADMYAQLEEFAPDAFSTPQTVVSGHGFDQRDGLNSNLGLPRRAFRSLFPVPAKCLTMPAEKSVRWDKKERLFPASGGPREEDQHYWIGLGTCWALDLAVEHNEQISKVASTGMAHVLHHGMKNRESLRKTADGYGVSRETIHRVIHATHRHYEAYFSMDDPSS